MASLKDFKASELAAALGVELGRGRPSAEMRADLEARVAAAKAAGTIKISKGRLVSVG